MKNLMRLKMNAEIAPSGSGTQAFRSRHGATGGGYSSPSAAA
jgi:hypothetical protein